MKAIIEHIVRLTDHRDRDLLELTLAKALLDLIPVQRIVIARVIREGDQSRWLEVARLDAKGGGRITDPAHVSLDTLPRVHDLPDRLRCLETRERIEVAWAGPEGPRIYLLPLFLQAHTDDQGVLELHTDGPLDADALVVVDQLRRVYRNMYTLLEHSDRDALTGLLNRKSLDDAFYSAVLEDLEGIDPRQKHHDLPNERRHRVPANYWLGCAKIDNFALVARQHDPADIEALEQRIARQMHSSFRTYDRLYHLDTAVFCVLMHCPDEALVLAAFERFRLNVAQCNFAHLGRITVSCGFTPVQEDDTPESAIEKTLRAIDFAQRSGGNKACSYLGLAQRGFFDAERTAASTAANVS
ncbi:MAG: GGDEF domain-containing protein [Rhodoferax sp.]